jgi:hypothetical protein
LQHLEPHTGSAFPASLTPPSGSARQQIAGTGIRQFVLILLRINVHAFGLYVDRAGARGGIRSGFAQGRLAIQQLPI